MLNNIKKRITTLTSNHCTETAYVVSPCLGEAQQYGGVKPAMGSQPVPLQRQYI
jgi:hypothetical protein